MASDGSGVGLPPGREELREHARHTGSAGQLGGDLPPSTQSDGSIEEVDVSLELSCDATKEDKESNMDEEALEEDEGVLDKGEEERDETVEESEDSLKLVLEPDTDEEEEHGGRSAVPGETGEPKEEMKEDFGDIDALLELSSDSMDESGDLR